jgi:hypothetical protein
VLLSLTHDSNPYSPAHVSLPLSQDESPQHRH